MAGIHYNTKGTIEPQNRVQTELATQEQEWFELQPIEKKLIGYSLGLGLVLLVIFVFAFGIVH